MVVTALTMTVSFLCGCNPVLEQPMNSCMPREEPLKSVLSAIGAHKFAVYHGAYSFETWKQLTAFACAICAFVAWVTVFSHIFSYGSDCGQHLERRPSTLRSDDLNQCSSHSDHLQSAPQGVRRLDYLYHHTNDRLKFRKSSLSYPWYSSRCS